MPLQVRTTETGSTFEARTTNAEALFVDFHGTLSDCHYWRTLPSETHRAIQQLLFVDSPLLVDEWMRGKLTSERICRFLSDRLEVNYDLIYSGLIESCKSFKIDQSTMRGIQKARRETQVFLVTSNMDCFTRFVSPALRLTSVFDGVYNSSDFGLLKDDESGRIFQSIATEKDVDLTRSILIDDSPSTCETFMRLGGVARLVHNCQVSLQHLDVCLQRGFEFTFDEQVRR